MAKKIWKKIAVCIVVCIIICFVLIKEVIGSVTMSTFADKTYSEAYSVSVSTLFSNDWYYDGDDERFSRPNYLCLEKSSTTAGANFYVCCVIDINSDGTDPNSAKYYYKDSSGSIVSQTVNDSKIAELAYISWYADTQASSSSRWSCTFAFAYVWSSEHENARSLFSNASSLPDDEGQGSNNSIAQAAATYATNGSTTSGKVIKARIILFSGGAAQNTAFIYGEAVDATPEPSINKYIVSTDNGSYSRSTLSESDKTGSPVTVYPGDTITYTINIGNTGSATIDDLVVTDTFDSDYFSYTSSGSSSWSGSGRLLYNNN